MPSRYLYQTVVSNPYLAKTKIIKGMTQAEVQYKATQQQQAWAKEEADKRERNRQLALKTGLKAQAERDNQDAQDRLAALSHLLVRGLQPGVRFNWNALKNHRPFSVHFDFREPLPIYDQIAAQMQVPQRQAFFEMFIPSLRTKREQMEAAARAEVARLTAEREMRKADALRRHEALRQGYESERTAYNHGVDERRQRCEAGDPEAIVWVAQRVLDHLNLPEGYGKDSEVAFDAEGGTLVVSMPLPSPTEVPRVTGYKYIDSRKAIDAIEMKPKDADALYDSLIHQIALLTLHRIFTQVDNAVVQSVVYNGWVTGVDRATGKDFTSCIISVRATRDEFQALNLERVDPKECIRSLKGLVAGPLAQLPPVRPIMDLDTADKRFVESREVLANLTATDNLATMDWQDFEHLVRELFGRIFGGPDSEVRVTQASRDGGVDAVAFDPDPIRGGKFIIQAKRYNHVVPVEAVRALNGVMNDEGAVKGILVTTSYFGNDSREFVKNKPITLIDGSELVYLCQQHGYNVRIELQRGS